MSKNSMRVRVVSIGETKKFGDKDFQKRLLVGIIDGEYENYYAFDFVNDKVGLLDDILPDTYVTVHYNVRCRRVEKKGEDDMYFTSLSGWKIEA